VPNPNIHVPSELELWTTSLNTTDAYLTGSVKWEVNEMANFNMAMVKWGHKMTGMVRVKDKELEGLDQTATLYLTVDDVRKEVARLKKLGATEFKKPVDIPNMGSWGYVKIPGDVVIGLWQNAPEYVPQPKNVTNGPHAAGTVTFFELVTDEPEAAAKFLQKAWHWDFNEYDFNAQKYWYCMGNHESFSAGIRGALKNEKSPNLLPFLNVETIDGAQPALLKSGAKKITPKPLKYEPHGQISILTIPGGVQLGLWENSQKQGQAPEKEEHKEVKTAKRGVKRARPASASAKGKKKAAAPKKKARK